jgi:hypothetical protein
MDVDKLLTESDKSLIHYIAMTDRPTSLTEQAKVILHQRMLDKLILALNKNSDSADKLAARLNILTCVIGIATAIGAIAGIIQIFK